MSRVLEVGGRSIEVSNPEKTLFPNDGITKEDLARYYCRVGEIMLPHVRERAMTMQRYPDGIEADGFIQKEAPGHFPDWIERQTLPKENGEVNYVIANEVATLVYLADQGCITPHVALSRVDRPDHPDRMIFDMDPPEGSDDLEMIRDSVDQLKEILDELGLNSFLMTTGSKGYHVLVPLDRGDDFDTVRELARDVSELSATRHPDLLTVAQRKSKRGDRVFVDYLRNGYGQTAVAPYAIRALAGAPIATPLDWGELRASTPQQYTLDNIFKRLAQKDDPWADLDRGRGQALDEARKRVGRMMSTNEEKK